MACKESCVRSNAYTLQHLQYARNHIEIHPFIRPPTHEFYWTWQFSIFSPDIANNRNGNFWHDRFCSPSPRIKPKRWTLRIMRTLAPWSRHSVESRPTVGRPVGQLSGRLSVDRLTTVCQQSITDGRSTVDRHRVGRTSTDSRRTVDSGISPKLFSIIWEWKRSSLSWQRWWPVVIPWSRQPTRYNEPLLATHFSRFPLSSLNSRNVRIFFIAGNSFWGLISQQTPMQANVTLSLMMKQNNYSLLIKWYLGHQSISFFCTKPTDRLITGTVGRLSADCRPSFEWLSVSGG